MSDGHKRGDMMIHCYCLDDLAKEVERLKVEMDTTKKGFHSVEETRFQQWNEVTIHNDKLIEDRDRWRMLAGKMNQALLAVRFGSLEANFKQCTQTNEEIIDEALALYDSATKDPLLRAFEDDGIVNK